MNDENDEEYKKRITEIEDPIELLDEILEGSYFFNDRYYRDLADALLDTAQRIVNKHKGKEL